MPLEIEIKLRGESQEGGRERLRAAGAERVGKVREENVFFDRGDGSLRKADSGLRVRFSWREGADLPEVLLTFKGPAAVEGMRVREAFDVHVTPHDQMVPLLEGLGFVRQYSFEKDREARRMGGWLVGLDVMPVFGCFVEIEGPSEEAVRRVQGELGMGEMREHGVSYAKMVGEWVKESGGRELTFKRALK